MTRTTHTHKNHSPPSRRRPAVRRETVSNARARLKNHASSFAHIIRAIARTHLYPLELPSPPLHRVLNAISVPCQSKKRRKPQRLMPRRCVRDRANVNLISPITRTNRALERVTHQISQKLLFAHVRERFPRRVRAGVGHFIRAMSRRGIAPTPRGAFERDLIPRVTRVVGGFGAIKRARRRRNVFDWLLRMRRARAKGRRARGWRVCRAACAKIVANRGDSGQKSLNPCFTYTTHQTSIISCHISRHSTSSIE